MKNTTGLQIILAGAAMLLPSPAPAANESATPRSVPEQTLPREQNPPTSPDAPLSEKLENDEGVIVPPAAHTDEQIHAPTPAPNDKMPVIPPPGSPGGNPSVRPK